MDAPSPAAERRRELADLRRRAYGPDADIHGDPDALARLNELEDLERAHPAPATDSSLSSREQYAPGSGGASSTTLHPPTTPTTPTTAVVDALSPVVAAAHSPELTSPRERRWWRRIPVWAVVAVSLVVGLVLGISAVALSHPSDAADPDPDLTLAQTSLPAPRTTGFAQNLAYWGVDPSTVVSYEPFDSIHVWTGRRSDGSRCILLSPGGKIFTASCAASGLDPILDFIVHTNVPVSFEGNVLPEGSVIRFLARPRGVDVWARKSGATITDLTS